MSKKYRLKIVYSEITSKSIEFACELKKLGLDGRICTTKDGINFDFYPETVHSLTWDLNCLPKSFLTEIKEPLTCSEFIENTMNGADDAKRILVGYVWNTAIENDRLKIYQLIQTAEKELYEKLIVNDTLPTRMKSFIGTIKEAFDLIEEIINDNT